MDGIIYGVRNTVNGKWYIGQTTVGLENRRRQHLRSARNNYDRFAFHSAIRKYGEDGFEWTVLEYNINTHDELNEREKFWIREKRSLIRENGYNMNSGGNGTANHPSREETRKRLSNARMGHAVSTETRKRISIALKGKTLSEETRKRISIAHKGKPLSEETRKRLSIANKGKKLSEETRKRMSDSKKGKKRKKFSEETRKRMSIANKGKNAKPVLMFNRNGDFVAEFPSLKDAADYIGVNYSAVTMVLTGKRKTAGGGYDRKAGYTFKYKNENPDR